MPAGRGRKRGRGRGRARGRGTMQRSSPVETVPPKIQRLEIQQEDSLPSHEMNNEHVQITVTHTDTVEYVAVKDHVENINKQIVSANVIQDSVVSASKVSDAPVAEIKVEDGQLIKRKFYSIRKRKPFVDPYRLDQAKEEENNKLFLMPPTFAEIKEFSDNTNEYHSSMFRTQMDSTLKHVKVNERYWQFVDNFTEHFNDFLKQLKDHEFEEDSVKNLWNQWKVYMPFNSTIRSLSTMQEKQFKFLKPILPSFLLGDLAYGTASDRQQIIVDYGIVMPKQCFNLTDYKNFHYDRKRLLYLVYLVHELLKFRSFTYLSKHNVFFNYYNNNHLKPIVEIQVMNFKTTPITPNLLVRLVAVPEANTFDMVQLGPWQNNIKVSLIDSAAEESETTKFPTPFYNANVLHDLTLELNSKYLVKMYRSNKNLRDAAVFLRLWLETRQFHLGFSTFNIHILDMFMFYLHHKNIVNQRMSSYHVMRTVWYQLTISKWDEKGCGLSFSPFTDLEPAMPTLEDMHMNYGVVFIDLSGYYNICADLFPNVYHLVRSEAKRALQILESNDVNAFRVLFKNCIPLYSQVDYVLKISRADSVQQVLNLHKSVEDKLNFIGSPYSQLLNDTTRILQKGLGKRIRYIIPLQQNASNWHISSAPPTCKYLHIGLAIDLEYAFNAIDIGPKYIAAQACEFRQFWGQLASLRRFQDGSIQEAVVWSKETNIMTQKREIIVKIISFLMMHHFSLDDNDFECIGTQFNTVMKLNKAYKVEKLNAGISPDIDCEALSLRMIWAFDRLTQVVIGNKFIHIPVVGVAGISPAFYYCEAQPILPMATYVDKHIRSIQTIQAVLQIGHFSNRYHSLSMVRNLKIVTYFQLAHVLENRLGCKSDVTNDGIYVLYQGYCFHFMTSFTYELRLLKEIDNAKDKEVKDISPSVALELTYFILPSVCAGLKALHNLNSSYGPTVIITKRWLYSQLIDDGLWPDACTELLIAYMFLNPLIYNKTNNPQLGFIKFLRFLVEANWMHEAFIINFNDNLDRKQINKFRKHFTENREKYPTITIVTSYDTPERYGYWWTSNSHPDATIIKRVVSLARFTLNNIETSISASDKPFIKVSQLLLPTNKGYDLLVQIKPEELPNSLAFEYGSSFVEYTKPNWRPPLAGLNLMSEAIRRLRGAYSRFGVFFYNPCGGKEILVKWREGVFNAREFDEAQLQGTTLCEDTDQIRVCKNTLINDLKIVLKDFYLKICPPIEAKIIKQKRKMRRALILRRYAENSSSDDLTPRPSLKNNR